MRAQEMASSIILLLLHDDHKSSWYRPKILIQTHTHLIVIQPKCIIVRPNCLLDPPSHSLYCTCLIKAHCNNILFSLQFTNYSSQISLIRHNPLADIIMVHREGYNKLPDVCLFLLLL